MTLGEYCKRIAKDAPNLRNGNEDIGLRILCPEYSVNKVDVKTFPLSDKEDIFIICWSIERDGKLYATMEPSEVPFSYNYNFTSGEKTQYHTHDYIELAYVVEGEFQQRILGKDISFKQGELCLIDKNCLHQDYLYNRNCTVIFIGLANEIFDEVMVENIGGESILNFLRTALMKQKDIQQYLHFRPKKQEDKSVENMVLSLLLELECNDEASKYICKGYLMRILRYISMEYEFNLSNEQRRTMNWLVFQEISKYIEERSATITIRELVEKFHFNEDYYNRICKEKLGMTYSDYVQNLRLEKAHKLLTSTDFTVDTVADMVGYQNKGYFYKIYVQKYGITPAKTRKQIKEAENNI